jgi:hypothetical protein
MTVNSGRSRRPDTYEEAEAALVADVRRLGIHHRIEGWGLLGNGKRFLVCSCNRQARTEDLFWKHIEEDLARERGPEKR